ncbi:MAG: cysteine desulfurase [Firmicutes bacterium]|nr:cysteine desulfurase [Bacillota bacterium]
MIFLDNASTTKCSDSALKVLSAFSCENFYNPSAMYKNGATVKNEIENAREGILKLLKGDGGIVFTSGGTESNNLALFGAKKANGSRIIVSDLEHSAVYYPAKRLKELGYEVVFCPIDENGAVIFDEFKKLLTNKTALISVVHVSNETGAVNDIKKLCAEAKKINPNVIFHSDGTQAFGKIPINLRSLGVDMYSVSAHKVYSAKGTGALFVKKGIQLMPLLFGGGQESGVRSGTENVGGIMAFSCSAHETVALLKENAELASKLKSSILSQILEYSEIKILSPENGSPYILSLTSNAVRGEVMQHALESRGILIGTGSACASNKQTRRVPDALKLKGEYQYGIMRISFGAQNTIEEIGEFIKEFKSTYEELRKIKNG